jgi:5'-methylthioadenosine phosphorylase
MARMRIGIIGGTGLYEMEGVEKLREVAVETPFGSPSDAFLAGELGGAEVFFVPRHGRGHRFTPSEVPYRANIFALKKLGVDWIISVSAVGSLKEAIAPGHVVLVDQFIDRTRQRASTFFEKGLVAHVAFGDPVCSALRGYLLEAAAEVGATHHDGGTYVCMEGPAFSTKAESNLYRSWGASVIGMTNVPEAKLAREAEISYATMAMCTDYDCWHSDHDDVTVDQVVAVLKANVALAQRIIRVAVPRIVAHGGPSPARGALSNAVLTQAHAIPEHRRPILDVLTGKVVEA